VQKTDDSGDEVGKSFSFEEKDQRSTSARTGLKTAG
jgi:hypothetical protein